MPPVTSTRFAARDCTTVFRLPHPDGDLGTWVVFNLGDVMSCGTRYPTPRPSFDVHLMPCWNPSGATLSVAENMAARRQLQDSLLVEIGPTAVGAFHQAELTYAEELLVIEGLSHRRAALLARQAGQAWFWHLSPVQPADWSPDALLLSRRSAQSGRVLDRSRVACVPLAARGCVRPDTQPTPGAVCVPAGGGWVGASIREAANWSADRDDLAAVLGCDLCHRQPATAQTPPSEIGSGKPAPSRLVQRRSFTGHAYRTARDG